MKKNTFFIILLTICFTGASAQDFYLKAGTGYAFAMPGQKIDQSGNALNGSIVHNSSSTATYQLRSASYTSGALITIGGGYALSKNICVEVNAAIDIAPRNYTENNTGLTSSSGITYNYTAGRQAKNSIILTPWLVLKTDGSKWNVYMKMGIALAMNTGINLQETYVYQAGSIQTDTWLIHNYFSPGFAGATGIKLNLNNTISVWAEASMLYLNLSRKERDLETVVVNGQNYPLSQISGIKVVHYNKNGTSDNTKGNEVSLGQPYGNIGITAGISFGLTGKAKKKV